MARNSTPPDKPYDGFPLTAHPNGQWCKKIRGRLHYFGVWADWQGALNQYQAQRDDLYAGRTPRTSADGVTLGVLMDLFLSAKRQLADNGEITHPSYLDYVHTCDKIAAALSADLHLSQLQPADFERLRASLGRGRGPTTLKGDLTRTRMVFRFAWEAGILEAPLRYEKALKTPSARLFRQLANRRGPRMFTPEAIRALLEKAGRQLKAMIYLGVNCGFGNADCGTLPLDRLDLDGGWHTWGRPKTGLPRRCPLWPETVAALREVLARRKPPGNESLRHLVFLTKKGQSWCRSETDHANPLSAEFRKLAVACGVYRRSVTTYYTLRRTFATIGAETGDQVATDHIMGHVPPANDMSAVYRQRVSDAALRRVTDHVRAWLTSTA